MPRLNDALRAWPGAAFAATLKHELQHLPSGTLPLAQGVRDGGYVDDSALSVSIYGAEEHADAIEARVGVFFAEIIAGCSCGDDPEPQNVYCEMQVRIDKASAEASFRIASD